VGETVVSDRDAGRSAGERAPGRLFTAEEIAERLSVPKSWVYAETRAGRIPHVKLGRYYRYRPDAIDQWVADLERGPTAYRKYPADSESGGSRLD
jgi:excisionase family DNA binding protein